MFEEFLRQRGYKESDFSEEEKRTLMQMVGDLKKTTLTIEKWKGYVETMRDQVSKELEETPEFIRIFIFKFENRQQILLKARLRNYRIMLSLLTTPDKAQRAIEEALSNIKINK